VRKHTVQSPHVDSSVGAQSGLAPVWGLLDFRGRAPRLLGLFAHPDDEVFCVGGTLARCAQSGASTAIVSLTRGETGQIRDSKAATRRTLGATRVSEFVRSGEELGADQVECLDLGDGTLVKRSVGEVAAVVRSVIDRFSPDVVVSFGPDGATGHPDHITSCLATVEAIRTMPAPPRLLHARFPMRKQLLLDLIVDWLTSRDQRFSGTAAFAHALKLFADGSSMLGFAADQLNVEWFPTGSYVIEQGEPATELFCILSGSVDIVTESDDGTLCRRDTAGAGSFVGEDGLATGRPRNAHVIARDDVTCLVLAPHARDDSAGRGADSTTAGWASTGTRAEPPSAGVDGCFSIDVGESIGRKIAALAAHRSQYALDADLLPHKLLRSILGTEYFGVVTPGEGCEQ
jgi:LmbE family N-acetylglucosaminyl deacetylase